ncbi:hypothetical protein FKW77_001905 [Venturia effusa]|uniref:Uncharacterized protein n=1 Tax=Venturia effusa TaxID=50376 RepID=A0A517L8Q1_9PEZI|nr:hypothetical protein FKW77_001905 [Venturia effusa]
MAPVTRRQRQIAIKRQYIKAKAPTTFLSLPRELRQRILFQSLPYSIQLEYYYYRLRSEHYFDKLHRSVRQEYEDHCGKHARNLCKADPSGCVAEEVGYVKDKWEEEGDKLAETARENMNARSRNKRPKPSRSTRIKPSVGGPTSFLSLPREIRQQILNQAHDIGLYVEEVEIQTMYRWTVACDNNKAWLEARDKMFERAAELNNVDPSGLIEEDMGYVLGKWRVELAMLFEDSENGRRYLLPRRVAEKEN